MTKAIKPTSKKQPSPKTDFVESPQAESQRPVQTFGGAAAFEIRVCDRLVFSRQMADHNGTRLHVVAAWKNGEAGAPVYAIAITGRKRSDAELYGDALLSLVYAGGMKRPRVRTIERVADVLAQMMGLPAPERMRALTPN